MPSKGASKTWTGSKQNVLNIFDKFRVHSDANAELYPSTLRELPELTVCSRDMYERFATYLLTEYDKHGGGRLDYEVGVNHLRTLINMAADVWKSSGELPSTRKFFDCLDPKISSDSGAWLGGLIKNMKRSGFTLKVDSGQPLEKGAKKVGRTQVAAMSQQLARQGTAEAAKRKLGLKTLWMTAGRTGETAGMANDTLDWDFDAGCTEADVGQLKTSKLKLIALVSGANRHLDFYLDLGDYWTLQQQKPVYSPEDPTWLMPELQSASSPNNLLNVWVKDLLAENRGGSGTKEWEGFQVDSLPLKASAAGFRRGACNLIAQFLQAEIAVHTTGHDLRDMSALWEYLDADLALSIAAAVILAGHKPFSYGQLGRAPVPPSIVVLETIGVQEDALRLTINELFRIDEFTDAALRHGGSKRQIVLTCFATEVMYYEQRINATKGGKKCIEMRPVLIVMQEKVAVCFGSGDQAHNTLCRWSRLIFDEFNRNNLNTLDVASGSAAQLEQMASTIAQLGQTVSQQQAQLLQIQTNQHTIIESIQQLTATLQQQGVPIAAPEPPSSVKKKKADSVTDSPAQSPAKPASSAPPLKTGSTPPKAPPPMGGLMPMSATDGAAPPSGVVSSTHPPTTMKKLSAADLYLWMSAHAGAEPPGIGAHGAVGICYAFMSGMASDDERTYLARNDISEGSRRALSTYIGDLVRARIADAFVSEAGAELPNKLKADQTLAASAVENRQRELKSAYKITLAVDRQAFKLWRAGHVQSSAKNTAAEQKAVKIVNGNMEVAPEQAKKRPASGAAVSRSPKAPKAPKSS